MDTHCNIILVSAKPITAFRQSVADALSRVSAMVII